MPTKQPTTEPRLLSARSHWIEPGHREVIQKEEVFFVFADEWRGQPVVVPAEASRYSHTTWDDADPGNTKREVLGDWRVIVRTPKYGEDEYGRGKDATETARDRLRGPIETAVHAWLASPEYEASASSAFAYAAKRALTEHPGRVSGTRDARSILARFGDRMTDAHVDRLTRAFDAYDEYDRIMGEGQW